MENMEKEEITAYRLSPNEYTEDSFKKVSLTSNFTVNTEYQFF